MSLGTIPTFTVERSRASKQQQQSDALTWITARKGVRLRRNANQSVLNTTTTDISWDTEDEDTDGLWVIGTPTVITVPSGMGGLWIAAATIEIQGGFLTSGRSLLDIRPTTAIAGVPTIIRTPIGTGEDRASVLAEIPLAAADTVKATVFLTLGATRDIKAFFSMYRVGE